MKLSESLRERASELQALKAGFPPSAQWITSFQRTLAEAADEIERREQVYARHIRADRGLKDEADLLLHIIDGLGESHVRAVEVEKFLERAEKRGAEEACKEMGRWRKESGQ